jgi:dTDP-4-dehydrorhamnose 3,5-epimerase
VNVTPTALPEVLVISPRVFGDDRGFFFESWNARTFAAAGVDATFVQDNHSRSSRGVLRGLHYQIEHAQGKLVRASPAKYSMSSSTCAGAHRTSGAGSG